MMKDPQLLTTRDDIDALMRTFYGKAMADPVIGHFFTEAMHFDLDSHLPVIGDFWDSVLFGSAVYRTHRRNPLAIHAALHRKSSLEPRHFERWLHLFAESVDAAYAGTRAEFAKQRSQAVARRMLEFIADTG
jgi:hemoglobin